MTRYAKVKQVFAEHLRADYVPGQSDCFIMSCAVCDVLSGSKLVDEFRGSYDSVPKANRLLRKHGHKSLVEFFQTYFSTKAPAFAQLGDLAVVKNSQGQEHAAIYDGAYFIAKTPTGAERFGVDDCKAVFAIG